MRNRKTSLVSLLASAVLISITFFNIGAGAAMARAATPQSPSESSAADRFSGTWHWMFNGKSFATLILTHNPSGFSGSLTGAQIELNDDGSLRSAEPSGDPPSQIKKAWIDGSELHVTAMDGDDEMEWIVKLKDDRHAEIRPAGGPKMKPIPAEKAG